MTSIPSWARPGEKVVCISKTMRGYHANWVDQPSIGEVCVITDVAIGLLGKLEVCAIQIAGYHLEKDGVHYGFDLAAFRPLIARTQEQDVAKFKHMLNSTPADLEEVE